jgi:hypothetical protein
VAQEAEGVEKGKNNVNRQGHSIKDVKWEGAVQLNECQVSVAEAKPTNGRCGGCGGILSDL